MPELPEVETTARGLRERIVGLRVCSVSGVDWPRMFPGTSELELQETLGGLQVASVDRRGKYLLIEFEQDRWLSIHRKMSGNLLLQAPDVVAPPHTHLEIAFDHERVLRFVDARKFGRVNLFRSSAEIGTFLSERLGPDSLIDLDERLLAEKVRGRRGRIKSLLLDQAFLAGIGNLYADEALWLARIHPLRVADSLSKAEVRRLARAINQVLMLGIERRGTSFSTYRDADGLAGENQEFLNVYGRADEPCPRCGTRISRILIGARSSHFCKKCQRMPRGTAPRVASLAP